jgi:type IV pilus assembly protein PilW
MNPTKPARFAPTCPPRRLVAGASIVELMVGIVLGMIIVAALALLFANTSASRTEIERASRQIENGRFAIDLLSDDLRLAGFYGELSVMTIPAPMALPNPCSIAPADWAAAIPVPLHGYDAGTTPPPCVTPTVKPGTDVLVVRRASSCEASIAGCAAPQVNEPFLQVARCGTQVASIANSYRLGLQGMTVFDRQLRDCATAAPVRKYLVHIYFISTDNGQGSPIPTLKRMELTGTGFNEVPLVEGIEQLNFEYGIDTDGDGQTNGYTADPNLYRPAGCAACDPLSNWSNVVAVRINLLARNIDPTPGYTDAKIYTLGLDAANAPVTYEPRDSYKRHLFTTLVRLVNVSQRREMP